MIIFSTVLNGLACRAVETLGLQLCSVEDLAEGRRKRIASDDAEQGGLPSAIVALTPQKKARTTLEVCDMNNARGFGPMLMPRIWRGPWKLMT
jgi:hypothetical protein